MGIVLGSIVFGSSFLLLIMMWKALRATWWEPRVLRKWFEKQGVPCKPYRFLVGDLFEMGQMEDQVPSLPPLDPHAHDQLGPRILPYFYHFKNVYGKSLLLLLLLPFPLDFLVFYFYFSMFVFCGSAIFDFNMPSDKKETRFLLFSYNFQTNP